MVKKLLLNNKEYVFDVGNLPCIIHGKQHEGSSLLTVTAIAHLHQRENKILFLSGYPMARMELIDQIGESSSMYLADGNLSVGDAAKADIIFVQKENTDIFLKLFDRLEDVSDRVVLIKNFDLFDGGVVRRATNHSRLLLSGDLNNCTYSDEILKVSFAGKILFSQPEVETGVIVPKLEKYEAYFENSREEKGLLKTVL